jgi:transposase
VLQVIEAAEELPAIELSNESWLIGIMTPLSEKISLRKIAAGDISQLLAIVDKSTVSRATGRMPQITSCYEAGQDGSWLHRVLEARESQIMSSTPQACQ